MARFESSPAFRTLIDAPNEQLLELVYNVQLFYRLLESGMFSGKYGNAESNRRNQKIKAAQKKLGITNRELSLLVQQYGTKPFEVRNEQCKAITSI